MLLFLLWGQLLPSADCLFILLISQSIASIFFFFQTQWLSTCYSPEWHNRGGPLIIQTNVTDKQLQILTVLQTVVCAITHIYLLDSLEYLSSYRLIKGFEMPPCSLYFLLIRFLQELQEKMQSVMQQNCQRSSFCSAKGVALTRSVKPLMIQIAGFREGIFPSAFCFWAFVIYIYIVVYYDTKITC